MKKILVTGGAGYLGSHTVLELLENDYRVVIVDNLSNSSPESIKRVEKITNRSVDLNIFDINNSTKLHQLFKNNSFDAVIHFAGLKSVSESILKPLDYYKNNLRGSLSLIESMQNNNVKNLVFSSTAAIYGNQSEVPIKENAEIKPINPYGRSKYFVEQVLEDLCTTNNGWNITSLRYFNPIGAHESGEIGEDPNDIPNNLLPYVSQVAIGKLSKLKIYGNDYDTIDGTGVRDYIHVVDLAKAHLCALNHIKDNKGRYRTYNIGTGSGKSVLQVIKSFKKASGNDIPFEFVGRRPGDSPICYADVSLAKSKLGWQTSKTIDQACIDAWNWQLKNPNGYTDK